MKPSLGRLLAGLFLILVMTSVPALAESPYRDLDSENLDQDDTFEQTFTEVGVFAYYCKPHPYMVGTVTVVNDSNALSGRVTIDIVDFDYPQGDITVQLGTTVVWINQDSTIHTVTSTEFDTSPFLPGWALIAVLILGLGGGILLLRRR